MKVPCKTCGEYTEREAAYRVGLSSYCDRDCYILDYKKKIKRARSRVREKPRIPDSVRTAVLVRDSGECQLCYTRKDIHLHHIDYRDDSNHTEENLICLCQHCHIEVVHKNKKKYQPILKKIIESIYD